MKPSRVEGSRPNRSVCVLLTAVLLAATGCGIESDSTPRDVATERSLTGNPLSEGDAAVGTSRIYLVAPAEAGDPSLLRSTPRDVESGASPLIRSLLAGPNTEELASRLVTNIPQETELLSAPRLSGEVLFVDISPEITDLSGESLVLAVAQIVFTAAEIEGVRAVRLRVDGLDQRWPKGDGETGDGALTVYDFPGLVQSAQPPYPAVPSPG